MELVNIGGTDIVDGNHKLTLGLLWSIILHWQVRGCREISFFPGIMCINLLGFSQTLLGFWWQKILLLFWAGKQRQASVWLLTSVYWLPPMTRILVCAQLYSAS